MTKGVPLRRLYRKGNADIPVILVSAGPSLEKNVEDLKEAKGHALLNKYDKEAEKAADPAESRRLLAEANREIAKMLKEETGNTLDHVLFELSNSMKNAFSRSDA